MFYLRASDRDLILRSQQGDMRAREAMMQRYRPYAVKWALSRRIAHCEIDDRVQIASIALLSAVERYDCRRAGRFSTFAHRVIQSAFSHAIDGQQRAKRGGGSIADISMEDEDAHLAERIASCTAVDPRDAAVSGAHIQDLIRHSARSDLDRALLDQLMQGERVVDIARDLEVCPRRLYRMLNAMRKRARLKSIE